MADNAASAIRSALDTALSAVTQVKSVESGKTSDFAGFPAVRYFLSGIENNQEDTNSDYRTYQYTVDIITPVSSNGVSVATWEADLQDAIDAVMDKLGAEWTLSGNADNVTMQPSPVRVEEFPFGPANVLTLTVNVRTLIALS